MKFVNLTPHTINILRETDNGYEQVMAIEPSGEIARLAVTKRAVAKEDGVTLYETVFGEPSALPAAQPDTILIVSSLFRSGFDRPDLYVPGELVRDEKGQPVGCLGLSR